ncbi:MAG: HEAT repeat domain-containing protein [Spirochaetota bacterium]|nr:MAG: HEAT repeat domain-containing protein [Spirochaetota bacterium]
MEILKDIFMSVDPLLRYIIAAVVGAGIVCFIVLFLIFRARFVAVVKEAISGERDTIEGIKNQKIIRKANLITKLLKDTEKKQSSEILNKTGISQIWISTLRRTRKKNIFQNILNYYIQDGFFPCFKYAMQKSWYQKYLFNWMEENRLSLPLLSIAHSAYGEDFDGKMAYGLFSENLEEIKDLLGDPNWRGRFFAMKILFNTEDETVKQNLFELFQDPQPIIRKIMIEEFASPSERVKEILFNIILRDPNDNVRTSAQTKYRAFFVNFPEIDIEKLKPEETLHLIHALRKGNKDDEAIATELVLEDNLEIRYHAARYLEDSGTLKRYCSNLDMGDKKDFSRKLQIMRCSASVGVTRFLKDCINLASRESLYFAASILGEVGDETLITDLLKKVVDTDLQDVYRIACTAAVKRGMKEAKRLLGEEIHKYISDREVLLDLIEKVTPLPDSVFITPLLEVLEKREDLTEQTRKALLKKSNDMLIEKLVKIITEKHKSVSQRMKIQCLLLLAALRKEYCLSIILEYLPILPVEFVNELSPVLSSYPKGLLKQKVSYYLDQIDGEVRSHIIALIPKTGLKDFLPDIRNALNDADPMVRIAATYALVEMEDIRSFVRTLPLLKDPVEEVRDQVAFALGRTGRNTLMKAVSKIYYDENEITSVKRSIIKGLGESKTATSTEILVDFLEKEEILTNDIIDALKSHSEKENITIILERMKDAGAELKNRLSLLLKKIGIKAKPALVSLLESEFMSLKTYAGEVLDIVGGTDEEIVHLKHRDPAIRREAAKILSLIGTVKAFRGLIMASRDPDREVRVNVVKALEKLETKEGKAILRILEEDTDHKIRKYTHWALERLKAKELV